MIKLSPWPYYDKNVKLLWFGNVFQRGNLWRISVWFEVDGKPDLLDFPVGLIPLLRIAQWYHNGMPLPTQKAGSIGQFQVPHFDHGNTMDSLGPCRQVGYFLHRKPMMMSNKLRAFTVENVTYYIPYIELLRALFATNKEITNALFRPNGLSFIVEQVDKNSRNMHIMFNERVPKTLLEDDFIRHIAWILNDQRVQSSFESIFSNIYANYQRTSGTILEFQLPSLKDLTIYYRGIKQGNQVLIFEILGIDGFDDNLDRIDVRHPKLKERIYVKGTKKGVYSKNNPDDYIIHTTVPDVAKVDTNQPLIKNDTTSLGFRNDVVIKKHKIPSQSITKGTDIAVIAGRGGAIIDSAVNESIQGGNLQPINVQSLEIDNANKRTGLEEFLEMIRYLEIYNKDLEIDISIVDLPSNRRFAFLDTGDRRQCAIVRVTRNNRITYVIELARPDNHSVSTLLLYPDNNDLKEHDEKIQLVLRKLVYHQGHWPQIIDFTKSKKLRHTVKLHNEWAHRIFDNIV